MSSWTDDDIKRLFEQLIRAYQDESVRPRRRYSNLEDLADPTQLYVVVIRESASIAAVLMCHETTRPNGHVQVLVVRSLKELADAATKVSSGFGPQEWEISDSTSHFWERRITPVHSVLLRLSQAHRAHLSREQVSPFQILNKTIVNMAPRSGASWQIRLGEELPSATTFLEALGRDIVEVGKEPTDKVEYHEPPTVAFGAYAEPTVWIGKPPFPSVEDLILERPWMPDLTRSLVHQAPVGGVPTMVFSDGFVVAISDDAVTSRGTINQVFAAFSRCGVRVMAVPGFELIEVKRVDADADETTYQSAVLSRRNRLVDPRGTGAGVDEPSWVVSTDVIPDVLSFADVCAKDTGLRKEALRLLSVDTLLARGHLSEAFVMAWTLLETALHQRFVALWVRLGRKRSDINTIKRDWSMAQSVDLLRATGDLEEELAERLHLIRRARNKVVHELADATEGDVERCIQILNEVIELPSPATPIEAKRVFF